MKRIISTTCLITFFLTTSAQRVIDYRYCQSPVRDQGGRGTCTAFAIAACLETFSGVPANLSEQYLYACMQMDDYYDTTKSIDPGGSIIGYEKSLSKYGVLHESRMPYNKKQIQLSDSDQRLVRVIREAQLGPVGVLTQKDFAKTFVHPNDVKSYILMQAQDTGIIKQLLRDGHKAIAAGYYVNAKWSRWMNKKNLLITPDSVGYFTNDDPMLVYTFSELKRKYGDTVWNYVNPYFSILNWKQYSFDSWYNKEGHALTIVGYNDDGFIIKNSWGTGWGDKGYCVISYDYHMIFASQALVINKISFARPSPVTNMSPVFSDIRLKAVPGKKDEGLSFSLFSLDEKFEPVFSSVTYQLFEVAGMQKKLLDSKTVLAPLTGYNLGFATPLMVKKMTPPSVMAGKAYLQMEVEAIHAITNTVIKRVYKKIALRNDEYAAIK